MAGARTVTACATEAGCRDGAVRANKRSSCICSVCGRGPARGG